MGRGFKDDMKMREITCIMKAMEVGSEHGDWVALEKLSKLFHKRLNDMNDFIFIESENYPETPVDEV